MAELSFWIQESTEGNLQAYTMYTCKMSLKVKEEDSSKCPHA